MKIGLADRKKQLIEDLGIFHEMAGMQPAASRLFALLLISNRNELSFEEIYQTLEISKSAVSNAVNFLLKVQRIEYITKPGERKRYFRCRVASLNDGIQKHHENIEVFNSLLKRVLLQRPVETKDFNEGLNEVVGFLDFMRLELPLLHQKWNGI